MISLAVLGRFASAASWSENVEERRKAILAHLRERTGNDRVGQLA